jgi:hypothetical protein
MRPRFAFLPPLLSALFAGFLFVACQGEGEGQPCDTNAGNGGNDDCQPPLVCTQGLTNANSPRCCPQNRQNATTPECALSSSTSGNMMSAPPDASGDTATPTESGSSEASADAPAESTVEAGAETGSGGETGTGNDGATTDGNAAD